MAGSGPDDILRAENTREALRLRAQGVTFDDIADRLGLAKSTVWTYVRNAIDDIVREPAEMVREQELARLDLGIARLETAFTGGDIDVTEWIDGTVKLMKQRDRFYAFKERAVKELSEQTVDESAVDQWAAEMLRRHAKSDNLDELPDTIGELLGEDTAAPPAGTQE